MFIASGMLVVPSGQTSYTPDQIAAAREIFRIATTTTVAQRSAMRDRIISLQRRLGLSGADGLIGRQTAKAVSVVHGSAIPGIDISGVAMPALNPQSGGSAPAPVQGGSAPAHGGSTSAPVSQGDEPARRAAQELFEYVTSTPVANRDRARVERLQTAIGVDADGKVGPATGNRVFELISRRIPGTEGSARTSTATRTIVRSPSVVERSPEGSSIFSQAQGSLAGQDDVGAFFERNKVAIIATGAVLVLGGVAAVYFATRED